MNELFILLQELEKKNLDNFFIRHHGKSYKSTKVNDPGNSDFTVTEIKKLFSIAIADYFEGDISQEVLRRVTFHLVWEVVAKHWISSPRSKKYFFNLKLKRDEQLYSDLYWISEYFGYSLTRYEEITNDKWFSFVCSLLKCYETYSGNGLVLLNKLSVPESKILAQFKKDDVKTYINNIDNQKLENLFLDLCHLHNEQKISIDAISAFSFYLIEEERVLPRVFLNVTEAASKLAILERFSATSTKAFEDWKENRLIIAKFFQKEKKI